MKGRGGNLWEAFQAGGRTWEKNDCGSGIQHMARDLGLRNVLRAGSGIPEPRSCLFFLAVFRETKLCMFASKRGCTAGAPDRFQ